MMHDTREGGEGCKEESHYVAIGLEKGVLSYDSNTQKPTCQHLQSIIAAQLHQPT